jgi:hypothetical protein
MSSKVGAARTWASASPPVLETFERRRNSTS